MTDEELEQRRKQLRKHYSRQLALAYLCLAERELRKNDDDSDADAVARIKEAILQERTAET